MINNTSIDSFIYYCSVIKDLNISNVRLKIFFDSSDIVAMLLGMQNMVSEEGSFNDKLYSDEATFIYSLVYAGKLNGVYLTIPYQDEFLKCISDPYIFKEPLSKDNVLFLFEKINPIISLSRSDEKSIGKYMSEVFSKSHEFLKARYLFGELGWQQRLKHLAEKDILRIDPPGDDYVSIMESGVFKRLHAAYNDLRPERKRNNTIDSLVLTILHQRLMVFQEGKEDFLPVLYDRHGSFQEIIKSAELQDEFLYDFGGIKFNIICPAEFFKYLAIYYNQSEIYDFIQKNKSEEYHQNKQIIDFIFHGHESGIQFVRHYKQAIDNFLQSQFMQLCWSGLEHEASYDLNDFIKSINDFQWNTELARGEVNRIKEKLKENTSRYSIFHDMVESIYSSKDTISRIFTTNLQKYNAKDHTLYSNKRFELPAFPIPAQIAAETEKALDYLLLQSNDDPDAIIKKLMTYALSGLQDRNGRLLISLIILWVLEEYKLIIKVLDKLGGTHQHSCEILFHAASLAKTSSTSDNEDRIIKMLDKLIASDSSFNYKNDLAAGYIYLRLWERKCHQNFLGLLRELKLDRNHPVDALFYKGIDMLNKAANWLSDARRYMNSDKSYREVKYYFILHSLIYHLTLGGDNEEFNVLEETVHQLEYVEYAIPATWQYSYDGTLALYYLRKAVLAREKISQSEFHFFINNAAARIDSALKWVISNADRKKYEFLKSKIMKTTLDGYPF